MKESLRDLAEKVWDTKEINIEADMNKGNKNVRKKNMLHKRVDKVENFKEKTYENNEEVA